MKRFCIWIFMLNKRLLRKKEFLLLLCLIPLLVLGIRLVSKQDSGMVTIAISHQEEKDAETMQLIHKMMQEESIVQYVYAKEEQAREMVASGEVDCAWIFRKDFREKLMTTFSEKGEKVPPIYVVEQEDNVALQLARTKLYGNVYPYLAKLLCEHYLETEIFEGQEINRAQLQAYYEQATDWNDLFQMSYVEPDEVRERIGIEVTDAKESYLMVPIRGMLVIFLLICGLVVTLFYLQDIQRGMFAWIPVHRRGWLLYAYVFAAILDGGIVVCISQMLSEGRGISFRELLLLLLFMPVAAIFCDLVQLLCGTKENLARWIPLLVIAMLGLCPVFLDLGKDFALQYVFPPTYYLRALYSNEMLIAMFEYSLILFAVVCGLKKLRNKKIMK